ncbi:MAG: sugar ABC transporter ATP-binding protein [Aigarchaeota archaeon]|nr:sugar ABC transporter ATP-binding protein [Aigarchaeota archaeon]MCX8193226.1 sugar ABC transporter ATP-binding protein [Nitrososphaeria archaeon]MDW7986367.1 sugar ABC transporter ATP-binding protein [Nitrososphaerota archaeon]
MEGAKPLLEVRNVTKTFDKVVKALDNVSIEVGKNEIVSVVGENGAGKSTFMKIMVGVHQPDSGKMYYMGQEVPFPKNPLDALKRGISIVYQEKGVIPHLKVYQFLFLGLEEKFTKLGRLQLEKIISLARSVFEELGIKCDLVSSMYELPLSTQKMVEIARAILSIKLVVGEESKITPIIILDEPTAPLSIEERDELFSYLLSLKKSNSFIFVSHIIPEVMKFSDSIYVLRDGKLIAHHNVKLEKLSEEQLFKEIVGRESYHEVYAKYESAKIKDIDKRLVVLSIRELTKKGYYENISFDLHEGECIGLFGPAGCGKSEIARSLYGDIVADSGKIIVDNKVLKLKGEPHTRVKAGIGYFSGETGKELLLSWPIRKNISLVNFEKVTKTPLKIISVISFKAEKSLAEKIMNKLRIKAPSVETECYSLSGGNKQKVSVGKWLERSPRIMILEDPTIGIDVGAREDIYEALLEMKKNGISMILVSDDPKEYAILCDRIISIKDGVIQTTYTNEDFRKVIEL